MANKLISAVDLIKLEVSPLAADGGEGIDFKEVPVIHADTFTYEDTDPEIKEYKDVSGNTYYVTKKPGTVKMNASIGRYDLATKMKFQGGTFTAGADGQPGKWERGDQVETIEFSVRGTTADGVRVIFPRASVVASGKANEKAIGLALVFSAMKPAKAGVPIERWEDSEATAI